MHTYRGTFRLLLAGVIYFALFSTSPWADDLSWPQFRGANSSGIAANSQNPPIRFGPDEKVRWKTALPPGHSSP